MISLFLTSTARYMFVSLYWLIYIYSIRDKVEIYPKEIIAETAIELKILVELIRSAQKLKYLRFTFSAYQYSTLWSVTDLSADGDFGTRPFRLKSCKS